MKEVYKILSVDKERDDWLQGLKPGDFVVVETQETNFVSFIVGAHEGDFVVAGLRYGVHDGFARDIDQGYIRRAAPESLSVAIRIHLDVFKAAIAKYDKADVTSTEDDQFNEEAYSSRLFTLQAGDGVRIYGTRPQLINQSTMFAVQAVVEVSGDTIFTESGPFSRQLGRGKSGCLRESYIMPVKEADAPILKLVLSDLKLRSITTASLGRSAGNLLRVLANKGV